MDSSLILQHGEDVIAQRVGEEIILFDVLSGEYYSLNELGSRTWELLDGSRSVDELTGLLIAEYDAPAKVIEKDILSLLEDLQASNLLITVKTRD